MVDTTWIPHLFALTPPTAQKCEEAGTNEHPAWRVAMPRGRRSSLARHLCRFGPTYSLRSVALSSSVAATVYAGQLSHRLNTSSSILNSAVSRADLLG